MTVGQILNPSGPTGKIILGVDDVPENLFLLKVALKSAGFVFFSATSGTECLSLLGRVTPRLILLDIEMPELDGFETCRRIRSSRAHQHVPVAFLTARKTEEDVRKCIEVGGNDFIVKPVDIPVLLERVKHWTRRRAGAPATAV